MRASAAPRVERANGAFANGWGPRASQIMGEGGRWRDSGGTDGAGIAMEPIEDEPSQVAVRGQAAQEEDTQPRRGNETVYLVVCISSS